MLQAEWKQPGVDFRRVWRVRPCRRDGYNKTYVGEFPDEGYVELDYNFARDLIRMEYHPADDSERIYIAVIKNGVLLQEREFSTNRAVDLQHHIRPLTRYFQYFPDNHVLRAFGGLYGLPTQSQVAEKRLSREFLNWQNIRRSTFSDLIRSYLREKRIDENRKRPWYRRLLRRLPADLFDLSLATLPFWLFFRGDIRPETAAFSLGILGFLTGGIDSLWRQRTPLASKAILFLLPAASLMWLKIQLEQWAIFDPMPQVILTYLKAVLAG